MKIIRTLLLVLIASVLLAGLTTQARAQTTQPAPKFTEDDRSPDGASSDDPSAPAGPPASQPADGPAKSPEQPFLNPQMILLFGGMMLLFIFMSRGSKRKANTKRTDMLSAMKKGDRVTTIGGIIGTVMEVRDDEILVKIDESNNTRMRFARRAIHSVGDQGKDDNPEDKK